MRYYRVEGMREIIRNTDKSGEIVGIATKMPVYLKKYPYYKISFKPPDQSEAIIQSEREISEAEEITLEEAQGFSDEWAKDSAPIVKETKTMDGPPVRTIVPKTPENVASYNCKPAIDEMNRLYNLYGEK